MPNFFEKLGHGMKVIGATVVHAFESIFGKKESEDFAKATFNLLKTTFGQFVLAVIAELAGTDMSNDEKRKSAFDQISARAVADGHNLSDSIINMLIELAVNAVKGTMQPKLE